jgi:hypothetical protein
VTETGSLPYEDASYWNAGWLSPFGLNAGAPGSLLHRNGPPCTDKIRLKTRDKGLQAAFAELGVAEASLVQAGRLRNPGYSFGLLRGGDDMEIDRTRAR